MSAGGLGLQLPVEIACTRGNVSLASKGIPHRSSETKILEETDTKSSLISLAQILSTALKSVLCQLICAHSRVQAMLETLLGWNRSCKLISASQVLQSQLVQSQALGVPGYQHKTILIRLSIWGLKTVVFESADSFSSNSHDMNSTWRHTI